MVLTYRHQKNGMLVLTYRHQKNGMLVLTYRQQKNGMFVLTYRHQKNGMLVQSIFSLSIGRSDQGGYYGFSTYNIHINNQYRVYLDITNLTIVLNEVRYILQNMNVHSNSLNYRKMTLLTILSALFE